MSLAVDLIVSIALTILLAYIVARIDLYLIHRRAQRISERNRIVELLKRKY
jgi:hypothetical protein